MIVSFIVGICTGAVIGAVSVLFKIEKNIATDKEQVHKMVDDEYKHMMGY